jgi:hypothetical protein
VFSGQILPSFFLGTLSWVLGIGRSNDPIQEIRSYSPVAVPNAFSAADQNFDPPPKFSPTGSSFKNPPAPTSDALLWTPKANRNTYPGSFNPG